MISKWQKKRDHKIMITDEAINKVPRVQYKEIPETEYDNLLELARQVLQISKDENASNEVAITYSLESADHPALEKVPFYEVRLIHRKDIHTASDHSAGLFLRYYKQQHWHLHHGYSWKTASSGGQLRIFNCTFRAVIVNAQMPILQITAQIRLLIQRI